MTKPILPFVESMIGRPCNLSCIGCSTFSDLKWQGYVTADQGLSWLEPWKHRLNIQAWAPMGGEPFMNPQLKDWLRGVRYLLPDTQIRITTNGTLLDKHWDIVELLHELGNVNFKISLHVIDDKLQKNLEKLHSTWNWKPVHEYGIERWLTTNDFRYQLTSPDIFYRTFKGNYDVMEPHDNEPYDSFQYCSQKKCPMLYQGKLFKCGTLALTPSILERFNWPNKSKWEPYVIPGLSHDCSELELDEFLKNFGKPHSLCRQCPTLKDQSSIINHKITVTRK